MEELSSFRIPDVVHNRTLVYLYLDSSSGGSMARAQPNCDQVKEWLSAYCDASQFQD